ncbi:MAG: DUF448 domain-containing protein [Fusobacteriaceae bacterium]
MENNFPERTCIVCREKKNKKEFFRIAERDGKYIFDEEQKEQTRGLYVCKTRECLTRLSKHKKVKVGAEELFKMASQIKNEKKDYVNILKAMRNSQALVFGMNMVLDEIEHIHFIVIAEDASDKNDKKLVEKARERNIPYVIFGTKKELGEIFSKDEVTVIAINNKRIAHGLIN